ncbi:MAG: Alpha amylase catalytic region [Schlesneria sp.]|nr:Alpha amylase catalytic region [Schlesneria sp.]
MQEIVAEDGCQAFTLTISFNDSQAGNFIDWGVRADMANAPNVWAINLEVNQSNSQDRFRTFQLPVAGGSAEAVYYFVYNRRLGAQKCYESPSSSPKIRFAVWAPNAKSVSVVFGKASGYIADNDTGIDTSKQAIALSKTVDGTWESAPQENFAAYTGVPYMFKIENAQGKYVYRTDIHSRWQLGRGNRNPATATWDGDPDTLDGTVSCSVVIDQDVVRSEFEPTTEPPAVIGNGTFWTTELTPNVTVPSSIDDLIIYELHLGSLGFGRGTPGTLADATALLDHLSDLGVSAVELLPVSEFTGDLGWGYGDTHHFVVESSAGGRDKYKHFVRECHRRGIAVIQDVVYNHFDGDALRAEWQFDSDAPEDNIYYWYEGKSSNYPKPDGGYLNNGSTGYTPRFSDEQVRQLFISSAVQFIEEFHVDGLRVDLTQAIHRDNTLNANGWGISSANLFGQKFLREWSRTLRMLRPTVMLIAEDHTDWDAVTKMPNVGGLGFDSTWFAAFYHSLIGDSDMAGGAARLLRQAGLGDNSPLGMAAFAGQLWQSQFSKVVYHESHDEAGNAGGTMRTSKVAVNDAVLFGSTRDYAEARSRLAFGLSVLSAGTPMFFMGEEIVAQKLYKYNNVATSKEDLLGERNGHGKNMFRFYQDLIRLRRTNAAVRSRFIDILHAYDPTRVIAFTRRRGTTDVLIVANFSDQPYSDGYIIQVDSSRLPPGTWQETFNSDAAVYGGNNLGNFGAAIPVEGGRIQMRLPANGFLVLQRR